MNLRRYWTCALLSFLSARLLAQQEVTALELVETVKLPELHGRIAHLGVDFYRGRVFIAAQGDDCVEVLNVRTNTVTKHIAGIVEPHSVVYLKSLNRIFVTSGGDGSLHILNGTTFKPLTTVHLGRDPDAIRLDSTHKRVYAGYGDGALAVLDFNGKHLADIALKGRPESFQIAEQRSKLFVNVPDTHSIVVIDPSRLKVIAEWPVKDGLGNYAMALDEANKRVFVACRRPARLLVLDMDSGLVLANLPTVGDTDDLFYDPIHARIYAIGGEGQIAVYAQQTPDRYSNIEAVATSAGASTGLFVPEWNRLFVALREFAGHTAEMRIFEPR